MQISERGIDAPSAASLDSRLASVERQLMEGRLADAAAALESVASDVAARGPVLEWLAAARARVLAEQAISLLRAHAGVMHLNASASAE